MVRSTRVLGGMLLLLPAMVSVPIRAPLLLMAMVTTPRAVADGRMISKGRPLVMPTTTVPLTSVAAATSLGSAALAAMFAVNAGLGMAPTLTVH